MRDAGTAEHPILICGTRQVPVRFAGRVLTRAQHCGVARLDFFGGGTKVHIGAPGSRVARCLFDKVAAGALIYLTGNAHGRSLIDYNTFRDIKGPVVRCELQGDPANHRGTRVERCHNGYLGYGDNESVGLIQSSEFNDVNFDYVYCLFETVCGAPPPSARSCR